MPKTRPQKKINIEKEDFKASPFVVDLNSHIEKAPAKKNKQKELKEDFYDFFNKEGVETEKIKKSIFKKLAWDGFAHTRDNRKSTLLKFKNRVLKLFKVASLIFSWPIIMIGKMFYKSSYIAGYLIVLLAKGALFIPKSIINLFIYSYRKIFRKRTVYEKAWSAISSIKTRSPFSRSKSGFSFFKLKKKEKFRLRWHPVATFITVLLILILPFKILSYYTSLDSLKGKVLGATGEAINNLFSAGNSAKNLNFKEASENFSQAGTNFLQAQNQLSEINDLLLSLASIAPDKDIRLAGESKNILAAGEAASLMGRDLSLAVDSLLEKKDGDRDIVEILDNFIFYGRNTALDAKKLNLELSKIDYRNLPDEYQNKFLLMKDKGNFLESSLDEFIDLIENLKIFLGVEQDKRYLLIFQNNAELRATGGFFGSFALVDFSKGKIKNIETPGGGSYDTEAGLKEKIIAPKPLHMLNPLWHFWDSNWWPDWSVSAKKIMWFYEKSDGPTVDGVISLTPTVMEKILKVIGPIDMREKYGVIIDSDNFWQVTQRFSEQKPDITKEPKKIVGDLMNEVIKELPERSNRQLLFGLVNATEESLRERQILLNFKNEQLQQTIERYGWDGKLKNTKKDFLSVVNTNIGGGKSDRKMKEKIFHQAEISADGTIIDKVEISRQHTGLKGEEFSGLRNVDWIRIYVPRGSELIEARGFSDPNQAYFSDPDPKWKNDPDLAVENSAMIDQISGTRIYDESGKTVFANWLMVDPGGTANVYIRYKLPFKLIMDQSDESWWKKINTTLGIDKKSLASYSLLLQKQAGSMPSELLSILTLDDSFSNNYKKIWSYPQAENNNWIINDKLDVDKFWAIVWENK